MIYHPLPLSTLTYKSISSASLSATDCLGQSATAVANSSIYFYSYICIDHQLHIIIIIYIFLLSPLVLHSQGHKKLWRREKNHDQVCLSRLRRTYTSILPNELAKQTAVLFIVIWIWIFHWDMGYFIEDQCSKYYRS